MKQVIPIVFSNWGKKSLLFVIAAICFSGAAVAQNVDNGGKIAATQTICPGDAVALIENVEPASGGDETLEIEYLWMFGYTSVYNADQWEECDGANKGLDYQPGTINTTCYFVRCARRAGFETFLAETKPVGVIVNSTPTSDVADTEGFIGDGGTGANGAGGTGTSTIFAGGTVELTAVNAPNTTFAWEGDGIPDGSTGLSATLTTDGLAPGTYSYSLVATSNLTGCVTTTTFTFVVKGSTVETRADPCDCDNPQSGYVGADFYNQDFVRVTSNAEDETWALNNTGQTLYILSGPTGTPQEYSTATEILTGEEIPIEQVGTSNKYVANVWFKGDQGGWSANVNGLNSASNASTTVEGIGYSGAPCACVSPLPVELVDFNATLENEGVRLKWSTAAELNNSHFEIERSMDGSRFEYVNKVEGAGNSTELLNYSFFVENPTPGDNYFRLKQVDFDGQNEYSNVVSVRVDSDKPILSVVPNPVKETATIQFGDVVEAGTTVEVITTTGKVVRVIQTTGSSETIEMNDLAAGIYFIRVQNAPRKDQAYYKIVKQ